MTKLEKFAHLDEVYPSVKWILSLNVAEVSDKHLWVLRDNMENHAKNSDPEVRDAANLVIEKIDIIIWKTNRNFVSWEVMEAANNPNYRREFRSVA